MRYERRLNFISAISRQETVFDRRTGKSHIVRASSLLGDDEKSGFLNKKPFGVEFIGEGGSLEQPKITFALFSKAHNDRAAIKEGLKAYGKEN